MKGVVLAGGRGTRLRPMTRVVNKHIMPIYNDPLIYYPVRTLLEADINNIMVISNSEHIGKYIQLLENEEEFDAKFSYKVQAEPRGIAHAVSLAKDFVDEQVAVILGDNVLIGDVSNEIRSFKKSDQGARLFLTQVDEPAAYGVASVNNGRVTDIEEKPKNPESDYAVIGLYLYNRDVFEKIDNIDPSDRGEYEITTVNKRYIVEGTLTYNIFNGDWHDAGTPEGLFQASKAIREKRRGVQGNE